MYTAQSTEVVALDPLIAAGLTALIAKIKRETGLTVSIKDLTRTACWELIHNWDSTQQLVLE